MSHNFICIDWHLSNEKPEEGMCVVAHDPETDSVCTAVMIDGEWRLWFHECEPLPFVPDRWIPFDNRVLQSNMCPEIPMSALERAFERIRRLTEQCNKTVEQRMMKLSEETGELARSLSIDLDAPGTQYREKIPDETLQEIADVFIVSASILNHHLSMSAQAPDFINMIHKKLNKWDNILKSELETTNG